MNNGKLRMKENPYPGNAEPQLGSGKKKVEEEERAKLGLGVPRDDVPTGGAPVQESWYSRGYIPHYDSFRKLQSITFRLADSLPQSKLHQLELEIECCPESIREAERRKKNWRGYCSHGSRIPGDGLWRIEPSWGLAIPGRNY
jgi:hypothetical protein